MAIIGLSGYAKSGKDTVAEMIQELQPDTWEIKKFSGKLKIIASLLTGIPVDKFEDQEFKQSNLSEEWSTIQRKLGKRQDGIFSKITDMEIVPTSVREFLQKLGTDAVRDGLHTNAWVNALMADYKLMPNVTKHWFNAEWNGTHWVVGDREDLPKPLRNTIHEQEANYFYLNDKIEYPNWIVTDCRFPNEAKAIKEKGGVIVRIDRDGITPVNAHPSETALDGWDFDRRIENNGTLEELNESIKTLLNTI